MKSRDLIFYAIYIVLIVPFGTGTYILLSALGMPEGLGLSALTALGGCGLSGAIALTWYQWRLNHDAKRDRAERLLDTTPLDD